MELNNITILILGLVIVSIVGLIYHNELIVTTVIGGLIGYLSKDVNLNVNGPGNGDVVTYTKDVSDNTSKIGFSEDDEVA